MTQPYPLAILSDGLMLIGLHQTKDFNYPLLLISVSTRKENRRPESKRADSFKEMIGKSNVILDTWKDSISFCFL